MNFNVTRYWRMQTFELGLAIEFYFENSVKTIVGSDKSETIELYNSNSNSN